MVYAIAIPYCDIVVGEKMFVAIAKQNYLENLYSTKLFTSFLNLETIL